MPLTFRRMCLLPWSDSKDGLGSRRSVEGPVREALRTCKTDRVRGGAPLRKPVCRPRSRPGDDVGPYGLSTRQR